MSTFALIPGAGGNASYWSELVPLLTARGHDAVAIDIPEDDPALGLPEYAETALAAIGARPDVVLVAQSLGGFIAPLVAARRRVRAIALVNAMIPLPGERPGQWWDATGWQHARTSAARAAGYATEFDVETYFMHDLPADVRRRMEAGSPPRKIADTPFGQPCEFDRWPDVPITVVIARDDRFFPADFQQRVARERLGADVPIEIVPGSHLVALSNAGELATALLR